MFSLATDPGVVSVMERYRLNVVVLGELDPIDDRVAEKMEEHGGKVMGYNTNAGFRIDLRLRRDVLAAGFYPYAELVNTLLHELAHNVRGPHDATFWRTFAALKARYLCVHAELRGRGAAVAGRLLATVAGLEATGELADVVLATAAETQRQAMRPLSAELLEELRRGVATAEAELRGADMARWCAGGRAAGGGCVAFRLGGGGGGDSSSEYAPMAGAEDARARAAAAAQRRAAAAAGAAEQQDGEEQEHGL